MTEKHFLLSIAPTKPSDIPTEETVLNMGKALLEDTYQWKQGKTFHDVKTYYRAKDTTNDPHGTSWHCRVSEHNPDDVSFMRMWNKLGVDKPLNEKQFDANMDMVAKIKEFSPSAIIWSVHYKFPTPVSPRAFTALQVIKLEEAANQDGNGAPRRTGLIVTIPIDLSSPSDAALAAMELSGVKGRYVSVERIKELDNGKIEWRMATSNTPGGSIPNFVVESSIPSRIAQDVTHFFKWLKTHPDSTTTGAE